MNHLDSELGEMEEEAKRLYTADDISDPKEIPEERKGKINQLMDAMALKYLTYSMSIVPSCYHVGRFVV